MTPPDQTDAPHAFLADILSGLQKEQKAISPKYFYDQRGSLLFEKICELDEYYPTRTELKIMEDHAKSISSVVGPGCYLIEFGSGSSVKTRILLDHLENLAAYAPLDISEDHLKETAETLREAYPRLEILPISADFTQPFDLPACKVTPKKRVVYFPGSTIGNLNHQDGVGLLKNVVSLLGESGGMLIGVDLVKDKNILRAAYDDQEGVTAEFNMNVLRRLNNELGANFDLEQFKHRALYNEKKTRIEMYLESLSNQTIRIGEVEINIRAGEMIHTESSRKYTISHFARLASEAGFEVKEVWTDEKQLFSVQYLAVG